MEKRGLFWFVAQFIFFCAILFAPVIESFDGPLWLRAFGLLLLVGGATLAVLGYRALGGSHSPWTTPVEGGRLVTVGAYGFVRHPIYAGWILGALGWELLTCSLLGIGVAVALFVFYDLKSRVEEKWLAEKYAGYPAYQQRVKRLIPRIY